MVIAVPKILDVIENSKISAVKSSAYGYIDAIEFNNQMAKIDSSYNSILSTDTVSEINSKINLKGNKATEIYSLEFDGDKVSKIIICINDYRVEYKNRTAYVLGKCDKQETLDASDIQYINKEYNVETVEDALNDLYERVSKLDGTEIYTNSAYSDQRYLSNPVTLELEKGKYICNATYSAASSDGIASNYIGQVGNITPVITGCNDQLNSYVKAQYAISSHHVSTNFAGFVTSGVNFI